MCVCFESLNMFLSCSRKNHISDEQYNDDKILGPLDKCYYEK